MNAMKKRCAARVPSEQIGTLLLLTALGLFGCKDVNSPAQGLRRNDLAEPARQARSINNLDREIEKARESKSTDDFLLSPEAKKIYRNMD